MSGYAAFDDAFDFAAFHVDTTSADTVLSDAAVTVLVLSDAPVTVLMLSDSVATP